MKEDGELKPADLLVVYFALVIVQGNWHFYEKHSRRFLGSFKTSAACVLNIEEQMIQMKLK